MSIFCFNLDFTLMSKMQQINSGTLIEMIQLKYKKFLEMIEELNNIAQYFIDDDGSHLTFDIVKGTDTTFLWKVTVRIDCSKFNDDDTDIKSYRTLRLNQFINIYNHLKQQMETLKMFNNEASQISSNGACSALYDSCDNTNPSLYESICGKLQNESNEELCCICMERKPNLILTCSHNYCESCIKNWQVTSKTCPICRCKSGEDEAFVLADKPDYYNLQDEMSKSLFDITKKSSDKSRLSDESI